MTQAEISLNKALNRTFVLYKRHDENDIDEIPEILTLLEEKLNEAKSRQSSAVQMEEQFPDNALISLNRGMSESEIRTIEDVIRDVKRSSATLFAVSVTVFSNVPEVKPIFERSMPLYKASVRENGSPIFTKTKNEVPVLVIPPSCVYSGKQTLIAPERYRNQPIYAETGFAGFDYLYLDPKEDPTCKYLVCRDCGEPFTMNISLVRRYRKKGVSLPDRCTACRAKKQ